MKLKNKISQKLQDSSYWILNSPESFTLLMLMGTGIGSLVFTSSALLFILSKNWLFAIIFAVFSYASIKKFIQIYKSYKRLGLKEAMGGFTANEFVWKRDKQWKKIGGNKNGNSGYENDEGCNPKDEGRNRKVREEIRHIYR